MSTVVAFAPVGVKRFAIQKMGRPWGRNCLQAKFILSGRAWISVSDALFRNRKVRSNCLKIRKLISKVLKIHTFLISSYLTHGDLTIPIDMFNIFGLSFPNGPVVNSTLWHSHFTWWKISWATQWSSGRWKWWNDGVVDRKVRKWHRILTQKTNILKKYVGGDT